VSASSFRLVIGRHPSQYQNSPSFLVDGLYEAALLFRINSTIPNFYFPAMKQGSGFFAQFHEEFHLCRGNYNGYGIRPGGRQLRGGE
jgi:hypothetical protein